MVSFSIHCGESTFRCQMTWFRFPVRTPPGLKQTTSALARQVDEANRTVKISLRGPEAMEALRKSEQVIHAFRGCTWHQEWVCIWGHGASFIVEACTS